MALVELLRGTEVVVRTVGCAQERANAVDLSQWRACDAACGPAVFGGAKTDFDVVPHTTAPLFHLSPAIDCVCGWSVGVLK